MYISLILLPVGREREEKKRKPSKQTVFALISYVHVYMDRKERRKNASYHHKQTELDWVNSSSSSSSIRSNNSSSINSDYVCATRSTHKMNKMPADTEIKKQEKECSDMPWNKVHDFYF